MRKTKAELGKLGIIESHAGKLKDIQGTTTKIISIKNI